MKIRAVIFDIGQTLVYYAFPLNWSASYRPAFEGIAEKCKLNITEDEYTHISKVLTKYNTRIHPSEDEEKDMECAVNAGAMAVLINRSGEEKKYGQSYTIKELKELAAMIK